MLVINQFVVSQDTPLPATLPCVSPKMGTWSRWQLKTMASLFNKDFTGPVEQGNWQTITINVETYEPHRVEYYQPLTRDGNKRQFKYQWFGDYYVKNLPSRSWSLPIAQN